IHVQPFQTELYACRLCSSLTRREICEQPRSLCDKFPHKEGEPMHERVALTERERRKLNWLRQKVEEQARRVQALEAMQDDPLDEMFERDTAGAPSTAPADQVRQERVSQTDRSTEQPAQRTTTTAFPTGAYAS